MTEKKKESELALEKADGAAPVVPKPIEKVPLDELTPAAGVATDPADKELDRSLRKRFGYTLLWIHGVVNVAVMALVWLIAFDLAKLSDKVIITLIVSTVAELAGLLLAVTAYLFPSAHRPKPPAKKIARRSVRKRGV
jgi:hypothetical protein